MCNKPEHVKWLVDTGERLTTVDGKVVEVWEFCHQPDEQVLSAWARHFRNHYCLDSEIDDLRYPRSRTDYLVEVIFPDAKQFPGPLIRAGDFGEILISDFLEYVLGFWVPRVRYIDKPRRNFSIQGSDMIGFRPIGKGESPDDALIITEAKAQFTGNTMEAKLQEAVDHSIKDQIRKAESMNMVKRRILKRVGEAEKKQIKEYIERFQSPTDRPYKEVSGAAAIVSSNLYDPIVIQATTTAHHPNQSNLTLIVIRGASMMPLVHELYMRAANEA